MPGPQNWQTRLCRIGQEDVIAEEMLDFESVTRHAGFIMFKSYDAAGNVLLFSIAEDEFWEHVHRLTTGD